jgi:Glycosyltransferase sugar-binding region containing DXD motif
MNDAVDHANVKRPRRDFHFVFGLKPQTEPLHLAFYLALESCRRVNDPDTIHFHYRNEPWGSYWDRIKRHLTMHRISDQSTLNTAHYDTHSEGQFILREGLSYAHEADVVRLKVLRDAGGCYADMDTLFVRRYPDELFTHEFAIAEESALADARGVWQSSLCNAVMFAQSNSRFVNRWLADIPYSFDGSWSAHSCTAAARLAREFPDELTRLPWAWFYRFGITRDALASLFETQGSPRHDVMSIHLWSHLWWSEQRRDFSNFHQGLLNEKYVRESASPYAHVARRYLDSQ